ncbi:plastocyanin/azurin family copper-binding protein [Haladaptatus sp. NG-WS-4]
MKRRNVLRAVGTVGIASLAGCSSGANVPDTTDSGDPSTETTDGGDGGTDGGSKTRTVEMTDELTFAPERIEVEAGTTVTWENVGRVGHTITAYDGEIPDGADYFASGGFDSESAAIDGYPDAGNVPEGGTYEHTFETKGTYEYYCIPHEMNEMVGVVEVV